MRRSRILAAVVAASAVVALSACGSQPEVKPQTSVTPTTESQLTVAPTTEAAEALMPDVVCMNLQAAQNRIQEEGVFFSRSEDATGAGRRQLVDSNWIVVGQSPTAGSPIGEADALLSVVKLDEPNIC